MAFNPQMAPYLAAGGAGIGGMLSDWQNPADAAMGTMNGIPDMMEKYYHSYINAGNQALPQLQQQYGNLINNPGGQINQIGQSYQQSPGFQFALKNALNAGTNAAAAGGMAGSPQNQFQNMQTAVGLANQDYYNWLGNATGMYNTGLSGLGGLAGMGYNASNELAQSIANARMMQSQLQYQGQAAENQHSGGDLGAFLAGAAPIAASFL